MSHRVYANEYTVQPSHGQPVRDSILADAQREQLSSSHHPVLASGDIRQVQLTGSRYCVSLAQKRDLAGHAAMVSLPASRVVRSV